MSRHREAVTQVVDLLVARAAVAMTEDVAERLHTSNMHAMHIDLLDEVSAGAAFEALIGDLQEVVALGGVTDLRAADITIHLSVGSRNAVCAVSSQSTVRVMYVGRFVITPRIQTRWVHMWRDYVKDVQWLRV